MSALTRTRHAILEDLDRVLPLFEAYRRFYGEEARPAAARSFLRERFFLGESKVIVAEHDGEIAGFTQLFPSFSSVTLQRMWILNDLYVSGDHRGRGIGRRLLGAAAQFGRESNAKELFIEGAVANVTARTLYESFGFRLNREYMYYHYPLNKQADACKTQDENSVCEINDAF